MQPWNQAGLNRQGIPTENENRSSPDGTNPAASNTRNRQPASPWTAQTLLLRAMMPQLQEMSRAHSAAQQAFLSQFMGQRQGVGGSNIHPIAFGRSKTSRRRPPTRNNRRHGMRKQSKNLKGRRQRELGKRVGSSVTQERRVNTENLVFVWQFEEQGLWLIMEAQHSQKISNIDLNSSIDLVIGQSTYTVTRSGEDRAVQKNKGTNHTRALRRILQNENGQRVVWQFKENGGIYFTIPCTRLLQEFDILPIDSTVKYSIGTNTYSMTKTSLSEGVQKNTRTNVTRELRRQLLDPTLPDSSDFSDFTPQFEASLSEEKEDEMIKEDDLADLCEISPEEVKQEFLRTINMRNARVKHVKRVKVSERCQVTFQAIAKECTQEIYLFHGTKAETIPQILENGFNRDFNSRSVWGKGVYFASTSEISHSYALPNERKERSMLLCKVAIGEYCLGSRDTKPKTKPNSKIQYDCMVNDMRNPTIFVILRDYHAMPLYLITYTA